MSGTPKREQETVPESGTWLFSRNVHTRKGRRDVTIGSLFTILNRTTGRVPERADIVLERLPKVCRQRQFEFSGHQDTAFEFSVN